MGAGAVVGGSCGGIVDELPDDGGEDETLMASF